MGQGHCFISRPIFCPSDQLTWLLLQFMLLCFLYLGEVAATSLVYEQDKVFTMPVSYWCVEMLLVSSMTW